MTAPVFVDTNVLVYARDASERAKQPVAAEWLARLWKGREGRLSTQVLGEYYVTVTQKLRPGLSSAEAWQDVEDLFSWHPLEIGRGVIERARSVETRFGLSWWDAMIVAAAQSSGCRHLLSEDLDDGSDLGGVIVVNPFRHSPESILARS